MDIQQCRPDPHNFVKPEPEPVPVGKKRTELPPEEPKEQLPKKKAKKKNRCFQCNKRLGLIPFTCKCGAVTCIGCKWPDHDCSFDFRAEAIEQLTKNNPAVVADKIQRI